MCCRNTQQIDESSPPSSISTDRFVHQSVGVDASVHIVHIGELGLAHCTGGCEVSEGDGVENEVCLPKKLAIRDDLPP